MTLEIDGIVATSQQQHLEKLGASKEDGAFLHRDGRSRWRVEAAWESGGGSIGRQSSAPNWWARPTWRAMGARRVRGTCLLVVEAAVCSPGRVISRFQEYFFFQNLLSAKELRLEHVLHGLPLKVGEAWGVAEAFSKRVAVDLQLGDLHKMLALVLSI